VVSDEARYFVKSGGDATAALAAASEGSAGRLLDLSEVAGASPREAVAAALRKLWLRDPRRLPEEGYRRLCDMCRDLAARAAAELSLKDKRDLPSNGRVSASAEVTGPAVVGSAVRLSDAARALLGFDSPRDRNDGAMEGDKPALTEHVGRLDRLLDYIRQWATQARTASIAQVTLAAVLQMVPRSVLLQLPSLQNVISAASGYSERHAARVQRAL